MGYWQLGDPFTVRENLLPLDVQTLTSLYDGEIHQMDQLLGELNVLLDQAELIDRTLVVFTSAHGQELLEHGGYTYGHSLYDEVLHVPVIMAGPGVEFPAAVDTTVSLLDVAPTLAEIAGASLPPAISGHSLVPALQGDAMQERPVFGESLYRVPHESKGMYRDGFKVIYNVDLDRFELYDLKTDPDELQDIEAQAVSEAESLKRDLLQWMAHTNQVANELPRAAPPSEFKNAMW
jgi:arylsulfatase A-like enzyme